MKNNILKYKNFVKLIKENLEYIYKESLPEYLYHVSPYSNEIQKSGILKAQSFGGGFGGGHTKGVSFFKDIELAKDYQLGMILAIVLSKCNNKEEAISVFSKWIDKQEKRIGKDLKDLIRIFKSEWERREFLNEPVMDTIESVRKVIHLIGARNYSDRRLDDPIIIGGMERLKKLDSKNVKIITVKTQDINSEIIHGTDTDEIRVLGDVIIYKINESLRDKMIPKTEKEILSDLDKMTPHNMLFVSIEHNFKQGISRAIQLGVDINNHNEYLQTPLILASRLGNKEIVKHLLKMTNELDINWHEGGETALSVAVEYEKIEIVKILLENGADVNIQCNNFWDWTPLMFACRNENEEIVKLLLQYDADVNIKSERDETALTIASKNDSIEIIELLLKNGAKK